MTYATASAAGIRGWQDLVLWTALTLIAAVSFGLVLFPSAQETAPAQIDFDGSGTWGDAVGEQIFNTKVLVPGSNPLLFPVPNNAVLGTNYARFRLSSAGGLSPGGVASDGEVEDYLVTLHQSAPTNSLVITNLTFNVSNTVATVEWTSQSGITYQMQARTNLMISNSWVDVEATVLGPNNSQTNNMAVETNKFYRITAPWTP